MSGSNNEIANTGGPASSAEPSMEEILASIRRILKDEKPSAEAPEEDDVLVLDASMVVRPADDPPPAAAAGWTPEPPADFQHLETIFPEPDAREIAEPAYEREAPQPHLTSELSGPDLPPLNTETFDLPPPENPHPETIPTAPDTLEETTMSDDTQHNVQPPYGLVSEEASNAAAGSIGSLIRSIGSERAIAIGRAGLTLEDLVREELRPLLKAWLDSNLPLLVERIVRAEIERVVERSA
jgi:cell pole-organizing protein PopZ